MSTMINYLRRSASLLFAVSVACQVGCKVFGGGGGGGLGTVTPVVAPAGTSGANFTGTLPDGTKVTGAAIVGETVPTVTGTATAADGTVIKIRHGFYPGNQPPTPAGAG